MLVYLVFSCIHSSISIWPGLVPTEFTELIYILAGVFVGGSHQNGWNGVIQYTHVVFYHCS